MKDITRIKVIISIVKAGLENNIVDIYNKYQIPFQLFINAKGTASPSMLDYFGIEETKRSIILSIIPEYLEKDILYRMCKDLKMEEPGYGITITIPIASSSKYLSDNFKGEYIKEVKSMENNEKYYLIFTIIQEGYYEDIVNAAKKVGARGGTLINARGLGYKEAVQFLGFKLEPERDLVLIVADEKIKNKLMEEIVKKAGITTPGKGLCFAIEIDQAIGLDNIVEFKK